MLNTIKAIIENKQAVEINGVMVDLTTANMVVGVHERLSEKAKEGMEKMLNNDIEYTITKLWSMIAD